MAQNAMCGDAADWVPWRSRSDPKVLLLVNETAREIRVIEGNAERRLTAADPTAFALELADLERYYGAEPAVGSRDSSDVLANPQEAQGVAAAAPPKDSFSFLEVLRALAAIGVPITAVVALAVHFSAAAEPSQVVTNDDLRHLWIPWADRYGSPELRAAVAEAERGEGQLDHTRGFWELLRNDLARAVTPTLEGARRCPGSVILGRRIHIAGEHAQQVWARVDAAASALRAQFPRRASVELGHLTECAVAETGQAGLCLPLAVAHDYMGQIAESCYFIE